MDYRKLEIYELAFRNSIQIHKFSQYLPSLEKYELGSKVRRAAVSVALNIAPPNHNDN